MFSAIPLKRMAGRLRKPPRNEEAVASCRERSTIRPPGVGQPERRNEIKPSFECWKAKTASARLICSDDELAQLDSKLGAVFQQRKAQLSSAEQSNFVHNEVIWIKDRNKRCDLVGKDNMTIEVLVTSKPCLVQAIQSRVSELEAQISAPDGPVETAPNIADQNGAAVCISARDRYKDVRGPCFLSDGWLRKCTRASHDD